MAPKRSTASPSEKCPVATAERGIRGQRDLVHGVIYSDPLRADPVLAPARRRKITEQPEVREAAGIAGLVAMRGDARDRDAAPAEPLQRSIQIRARSVGQTAIPGGQAVDMQTDFVAEVRKLPDFEIEIGVVPNRRQC